MESQILIFQLIAYGEPINFIRYYSGYLAVTSCKWELIMLIRSWVDIEFAEIITQQCLNTKKQS